MTSIDHSPSPHIDSPFLLCPSVREFECVSRVSGYYIAKTPYCFNEPVNNHHHLHPLAWCNNKEGEPNGFKCYGCKLTTIGTTYYYCDGCYGSCHKECVESPPEILVPAYHCKHPLQLLISIVSASTVSHCCGSRNDGLFYYCFSCDFSIHPVCARKPTLLYHPKCHEHTLIYFHRKAYLTCNVCGFDEKRFFIYICPQCDFVVHKMCLYIPRVIIISRHNHRLSLTSCLSSGEWLCGVCHKKINENYSKYHCVKGCEFFVHTTCATQEDVWDGKDLEDEPDDEENTLPFEELGDGTICHFSHQHHPLRLFEKIDGVYDENTYCQACMLPLYDENIYKCEHCDFNLHQTCAVLPLKKLHMLHRHPLILQADCGNSYQCEGCGCLFSGFRYVCSSEDCYFSLDVKCSKVSEPFHYRCHPHPLFLNVESRPYRQCWACFRGVPVSLDCIVCDFSSCFRCATLPYKVRYEHDDHFLMLSRVEKQNEEYWCEVCEKDIFSDGEGQDIFPWRGVYACNNCSVTLHIHCAVGLDLYKPGQTYEFYNEKYEVRVNSHLTRPICNYCKRHCQYKLLLKRVKSCGTVKTYCSTECLW